MNQPLTHHPHQSITSQHLIPPRPPSIMNPRLQPTTFLWWRPHLTIPLPPTMSPSPTMSQSTTNMVRLDTPVWTTLVTPTLPTPSSVVLMSPSPLACTPIQNLDVRRTACATTEGTGLKEPALSVPTEPSLTSTCSGASSGTRWTAAQQCPSTASTPTPSSTHTCPNPSSMSMATPSLLQLWLMLTHTMLWSIMLRLFTMLSLIILLHSTMPLLIMQPQCIMPLPTMQLQSLTLWPTTQLLSTTPHQSILWRSQPTRLPSTLDQPPKSTMQWHLQSMLQLLPFMRLPLLQSMQLLQSVTASHLSLTLESKRCHGTVLVPTLTNIIVNSFFIYSVQYNSQTP